MGVQEEEEEGGDDAAQDPSSMRSENGCRASASRCLMSSNSIPMTSHQETSDEAGVSLSHVTILRRPEFFRSEYGITFKIN